MGDATFGAMGDAPMMPCDQVIARLWEYLDGELPDRQAAGIRAHLAMCARCFPQYDFDRAFLTLLERHRSVPVPGALRERVFQAVLEDQVRAPEREASVWGGLVRWLRGARGRR